MLFAKWEGRSTLLQYRDVCTGARSNMPPRCPEDTCTIIATLVSLQRKSPMQTLSARATATLTISRAQAMQRTGLPCAASFCFGSVERAGPISRGDTLGQAALLRAAASDLPQCCPISHHLPSAC